MCTYQALVRESEEKDQNLNWYEEACEMFNLTVSLQEIFEGEDVKAKREALVTLGSNFSLSEKI